MKLPRCARSSKPIILELDLARGVVTAPPSNPLEALKLRNSPTMASLRDGLRRAAGDDAVRGLIVHVGQQPLPPAVCDEVASLIETFAEHKPTIAWSESFGELEHNVFGYRAAVAADEVWLQPSGGLGIGGVHLDITLFKGLLTKVGLEPQFAQRKEYKTAADQFAADEVTQANREMVTRLGQSLMERVVDEIAQARALTPDQVWDAVNASPLSAEDAHAARFVDHLGYRDDVYASAHERWGTGPENLLYVHRYHLVDKVPALIASRTKDSVAVVGIDGGIVSGRGTPTPFGGQQAAGDVVTEHLRAALRDDHAKAVVLRVNSPGGSYIASDAIWRGVHHLRDAGKPVVAVMTDVAASGGYYVSMGADEIVAAPSTITGSIGVLAGKFVNRDLLDKLDITREGIDIGARAGMLRSNRPFTDEEWEVLNVWLDRVYDDFTHKAADDRGFDHDTLEPLAHGRVWTGADAHAHGLVDHLGGMELGIERACALAGLDRDTAGVRRIGAGKVLDQLRPARSSESLTGAGATVSLPTGPEGLFQAATRALGLDLPGVLTLPLRIRIT